MNCIKKSALLFLLLCVINIGSKVHANIDTIVVSSFVFTPSTITINSGDSVFFSGASAFHPVVSDDGSWTQFTTNTLLTTEITAAKDYYFHCFNHGLAGGGACGMCGVITVLPPPIDASKCANLFFSEYFEGSSWNKALEIYNPTNDTINLSNYEVKRYTNGSPTATATLNLAGQLLPDEVYVIVHSSADSATLHIKADTITSFANFNGDDALAIFRLTDSILIDIIGEIGIDPGTEWIVGTGSTFNNTLVRKPSTHQGQIDWTASVTEWDVFPIDDSSHIGFHIMNSTTAIAFVADAGTDDTLCLGNTLVLNASASGGTSSYGFAWFADATLSDTSIANPVASPVVTTSYSVIVTDLITGCSDTGMVTVTVMPGTIADAGIDDTVCSGNCSQLLASGGITYSWSPGASLSDSTIANPLACPSTTINYVVTVMNAAGCSDMDTVTIVVNSTLVISITPSADTICFGDTTTLTASGALTYLWNPTSSVSDSTASIVSAYPTSTTTYTVNGVDGNGCISDTNITVLVSVPVVSVTPSPGTVCGIGDSVMLTASGVLTYLWSPSDSLSNITGAVVYANPTANTVYTVVGTDTLGCVDTETVSVQISAAIPVPVFSADTTSGCGSVTVSFTNTSTDAIGYSWNLPGGTTADTTLQDPVVTYNSVGTFDVTLTAFGCSLDSTITMAGYITVNPNPLAGFTTANVCLNDSAVFADASTVSSGNIISWNWDFGDGTSTNQNPKHLYSTDGTYNVSLIVTTNNSCVDTMILPLTIYPVPTANFTTINFCLNDTTLFADLSTINAPGSIVSWQWNFGDGFSVDTNQNPSHNYAIDSLYFVTLSVTSNDGCIGSVLQTVEIYPLPTAGFTSTTTGLSVVFADASAGTIATYSWDYGDGVGTGAINNPNYTYNTGDTYNVCLTVVDINTCQDTHCESVTVIGTGIQEQNLESSINIYPNPTSNGMVNVDFGSVIYDDVQLKVYNILGETMEEREIPGHGKQVINLSGIANGVYFLYFSARLTNGEEKFLFAKKVQLN